MFRTGSQATSLAKVWEVRCELCCCVRFPHVFPFEIAAFLWKSSLFEKSRCARENSYLVIGNQYFVEKSCLPFEEGICCRNLYVLSPKAYGFEYKKQWKVSGRQPSDIASQNLRSPMWVMLLCLVIHVFQLKSELSNGSHRRLRNSDIRVKMHIFSCKIQIALKTIASLLRNQYVVEACMSCLKTTDGFDHKKQWKVSQAHETCIEGVQRLLQHLSKQCDKHIILPEACIAPSATICEQEANRTTPHRCVCILVEVNSRPAACDPRLSSVSKRQTAQNHRRCSVLFWRARGQQHNTP